LPDIDTDIAGLGIADLGAAPISKAAPAGVSARYEPEFERIETEIAKLQALNGAPVDWRVVAENGIAILRGKSKDLLVAGFLCRGLFEVHGYQGLGAGLKAMRTMSEQFWDRLFPEAKRPRARAAAGAWLAERLTSAVERQAPAANDRKPIELCLAELDILGALLDEKLGERSPSFGELRRALQVRLEALPDPKAAAETAPAPSAAPAPVGTPSPATATSPAPAPAPNDIGSDSDVQKGYRAGRDLLRKIAQYLRSKDPANAAPYILARQSAWLGIDLAPPDRDGVTALREVSADRIAALEALSKAENYPDLIEQVETTLARAPFWLDGHRMTAAALEALGHDRAQRAVIETLAGFLRRFPELLTLKFASKVPFASEIARTWIDAEVLPAAGADRPAASPVKTARAETGAAPWIEAAEEAKKLATKGKLQAALSLLQVGQRQCHSARERFLWAREQAQLCQAVGRNDLALPQLEHLDQQATHYRLEEWEPDLSLEIAGLLLSCYKNQASRDKSTPERRARMEQLQARIVRLDILAAVDSPQQ